MKRFLSGVVAGALALSLGAVFGATSASAATDPTLVLSGGSAVYGIGTGTIVATASAPGAVAFSANGAVITGCEAVATATATPFVAKCVWTPNKPGANVLSGTLTPTDATSFNKVTSPDFTVKVGVPVQGDPVTPIHIYVDTVLGSGTTGALGPRFGVGCAIQGEFIVGQLIVFRVYANNEELGGANMTPLNTAQAYITVPGVAAPIQLNYGNHSGVAFWTGTLKTGTAPGQYNTLGTINYTVTMVAKPTTTMQVLASKVQPVMKDGMRQRDADGKFLYERVPYFRTVQLATPLKGAVGTWSNNFTPASWLSLHAVPTP